MQSIQVSEDIVPIGKFKAATARWLQHIRETGRPLVITQNGEPAGVLVSPAQFDRMHYHMRFEESVARGIEDADAGRVMNTEELRKRLDEARNHRQR